MKVSLAISNFLRDLYSFPFYCFLLFLCIDHQGRLSYLSLLFFGTLHSNGCIFPFLLCFSLLFFSDLFVRPPQTAILLFCISFSWGWSWSLSPFSVMNLHPWFIRHIFRLEKKLSCINYYIFLWCDRANARILRGSFNTLALLYMFSSHPVSFLDHITITPKDPQWVGAWWLGYLIAGSITLLAAVPFWCLPRTLPRPRSREDSSSSSEKSKFIMDDHTDYQTPPGEKAKIMEMARGKPDSLWFWSTFHIPVETFEVIYKQYFSLHFMCSEKIVDKLYRKPGFPCGTMVKNLSANEGDAGDFRVWSLDQ